MSPYAGSGRPTQKDKTLRAYRAYFDLLDAAAWTQQWLRSQLAMFGTNLLGLRVVEMLYRDGAMEMIEIAQKRECPLQNLHALVSRLEARGWVQRKNMRRYPTAIRETRVPITRRGTNRRGRRVSVVRLTPLGEKFAGWALPKNMKVVKALMRTLDGREQETLSNLCRKLTEGHILKFISEMTHVYAGE
jgi:DNA-binding MarR family transcriptional regulator